MTTVAELAIDALRKLSIHTLYCIPGVQNDDFFDALVDARDITPIVTRHEQGAAYMAMGHAQAAGHPAAFCVVPGPGMLNTTAALTSAYWAGAPVFALIGAVPTWQAGKGIGVLHDLADPAAVLRQVTKHTGYVSGGDTAAEVLASALDRLLAYEPRPVSVEFPVDCWNQEIDGVLAMPAPTLPAVDTDQVEHIAGVLAAASRPLIVVGSGAYGASPEVRELAERLEAPVFTRRQGHGVLDARHRLWVPLTVGHGLWPEADVVVGIGTRLEFPLLRWGIDDDLTIVQVNIDEAELDRHGWGTIGLHSDAAEGVRAILDVLPADATGGRRLDDELNHRRADFEAATAHLEPQRETMNAIRDVLPDDGIIVEDVTQMGFAAHFLFEFRHPRTFLTSGPAGRLGAGVAQAIGAQLGAGERKVLGLIGDGGFLFTATELATAAQYDIPVTLLLHDNGAYGNVKRIQTERFGPDRTIASSLQNPDFIAFGESFGVQSLRADDVGSLRAALETGFSHAGPTLIVSSMGEVPNPWPFMALPRNRGASKRPR
ncbi:MAG: TPP-binding protein [Acidimicrobiia bacterium]|nr:TPP-binding protein [Acidimicrobiia bacterium]